MEPASIPKVGVGVFIFKDGKVLFGKRKGTHAAGEYAPPGGHMEYMESFVGCVMRETFEETGMKIKNIRLLCVLNLKKYEPRHYVNLGFIADWESGDPQVMEPKKVGEWGWYELDKIPQPWFATIAVYLEALKTGKNFFDS